jgi:single-stranded-DNA-specific exonuclease
MSYSIGSSLTPISIAFYIAPAINAVIRIGSQEEKEIVFKALLDKEGAELIKSGKRGHTDEDVPLVEEALR